jgi:SAM-dependent methyltransferase
LSVFSGRFVGLKLFLLRTLRRIRQPLWRIKYLLGREKLPVNDDGRVYVNLGCGASTSAEFVNVDAVPQRRTHFVADIQSLLMFPDDSVDLVYASHVIEHLPRKHLDRTLKEWFRTLKPGGTLRFGVPDFDSLVDMYHASGNDPEAIVDQLLGQDGEYDDHHTIWNRAYAEKVLRGVGFTNVRAWDPETVDHHEFTDKTARAYEVDGRRIPISLNLEATKPHT